ncbi:MAG TPA: hypothetical protein DEO87_08935, partial [Lachnospiraceae bacterium]|nr:hypothetical protein [Lachnospiraceae bacterium]
GLKNLRLFEFRSEADRTIDHISQDLTRLVFMVDGITGRKAAQILEERYGLIFEMAGTDYITAISTVMDNNADLTKLLDALIMLDKAIVDILRKSKDHHSGINSIIKKIYLESSDGVYPLAESVGKRITGYIYVYPPGIPIIAPFEMIEEKHIHEVVHSINCGHVVHGIIVRE